jgi:cobalamin biosynthesis protein CobT
VTPYSPLSELALDGYAALYRDVAGLVDTLARNLEDQLRPRRRLRFERGFAHGRRVDLRALMASEADPSQLAKPFMRPNIPDRRTAAFGLLVDLSGSMRGQKIEAALRGACLMAEVLARLDLPFRMDGFQDELIPIVDFHQGLGPALRATLPELALEPEGARLGGHNVPRQNDDGPCLLEAADHLLKHPARDQFLIVISDGKPEGRHSAPRDLHDAVRTLAAQGLAPIGIGLGPGTSHVADYYPHHLANVPLGDLARRLGGVIGRLATQT